MALKLRRQDGMITTGAVSFKRVLGCTTHTSYPRTSKPKSIGIAIAPRTQRAQTAMMAEAGTLARNCRIATL